MKQMMFAALAFLFLEVGFQVKDFPVKQIGSNIVTTTANLKDASGQLDADLKQIPATITRANTSLDKLPYVIANVNKTFDNINRPCGQKLPCGAIANFNETLHVTKSVLTHIDIAARHEDQNLGHFDKLTADLHDNLQSSNALLVGVTPRLDALIEQSTKTISNPDIPKTLSNVQGMTASGDVILKDSSDKFHQIVHPDKKKLGVWGVVNATIMYIHRITPPLF